MELLHDPDIRIFCKGGMDLSLGLFLWAHWIALWWIIEYAFHKGNYNTMKIIDVFQHWHYILLDKTVWSLWSHAWTDNERQLMYLYRILIKYNQHVAHCSLSYQSLYAVSLALQQNRFSFHYLLFISPMDWTDHSLLTSYLGLITVSQLPTPTCIPAKS